MTDIQKKFIQLRAQAIASQFAHLNPEQQKAVCKTEGPLLILAGAGSGKTTVLINRIVNLLRFGRASDSSGAPENATADDVALLEAFLREPAVPMPEHVARVCREGRVWPSEILAITFTNRAAGELKSRLDAAIGPDAADVWAMTFHSACVRLLRRNADKLGYTNKFLIYDSADSQSMIKRILSEFELDSEKYAPKKVQNIISGAKSACMTAAQLKDEANFNHDSFKKAVADVYTEYQSRLKTADAMDFDDLLLETVRLLRENDDVRAYYRNKFRYLLIDEYQDTNGLQYEFARLLTNDGQNICVVGDDDQSIYAFRGATIENILSFEEKFQNAAVIRLEQNYRSTSHILSAANSVIENNDGRHSKKLWSELGDGQLPRLVVSLDEREEARFAADKILDGLASGKSFSDFAVLYRTSAQSLNFEQELTRRNIPYRIHGGTGFFARAEIKDVCAYLSVIENRADDVRTLRVINNPPRGIGAATVETLRGAAAREGLCMADVVANSEEYPELAKTAPKLRVFFDMMDYLRDMAATLALSDFYDALIDASGLVAELQKKNTETERNKIENIAELRSMIMAFEKNRPEGTLGEFLEETALLTDADRDTDTNEKVVLMTIHSAKGLEFDTVFIGGCEDGLFPGYRSIGEQSEMEEERRLCYVAMTRAKRQLYFLQARRRTLYGKTNGTIVSRFIEEIDPQHIEMPKEKPSYADFAGFGESGSGGGYGSGGYDAYRPYGGAQRSYGAAQKRPKPAPAPVPAAAPVPKFAAGQSVQHKAFGAGTVVSATPAGSDTLLIIDFSGQQRKLLANTAHKFMEIL
ncbi:MAG: UvrD-helicase domain-containing protein [Oscillospiraceae bacterium]|jgi:DNA helicase-2/ATP-dependent DNA helicase PcrA|nr:UvrD-helicase domain-containing protein [Oscillospiraceae bacterium]